VKNGISSGPEKRIKFRIMFQGKISSTFPKMRPDLMTILGESTIAASGNLSRKPYRVGIEREHKEPEIMP
jgi:hypothetical protein